MGDGWPTTRAGTGRGDIVAMSNAVAALRNTPEGALQGQGPDPAPAQDLMAANLAQHALTRP